MVNRKAVIFFLCAAVTVLTTVALNLFLTKEESPADVTSGIQKNLEAELKTIEGEAQILMSSNAESVWENVSHSFFLFDSIHVLDWNRNDFLPDARMLREDFKVKLLQSSRGSFLITKWVVPHGRYLISLLPLAQRYSISNSYLPAEWNLIIFRSPGVQILDPLSQEGDPIRVQGNILFKVKLSKEILASYSVRENGVLISGWVSVLLFTTGLYLLIVGLHRQRKFGLAFSMLLLGLGIVRSIMIAFDFPRDFSTSFVFDPLQFASSDLNPSIADLFFNTLAVLIVAIYFFSTYYKWHLIRKTWHLNPLMKFLVATISLIVCFYTILFPFLFFETISHNSNIPLDISQSIHFDLIRVLGYFSIILGSVAAFLFGHVFFKLALSFTRKSDGLFYATLAVAALGFVVAYVTSGKNYLPSLISGLVYFALVFQLNLSSSLKRLSYNTFFYFFLTIMVLSAQGSFSVKRLREEKTKEDQFKYGNNFLVGRDNFGEYLLHELVRRLSEDPFIQSRMATHFLSKSAVRQKIQQVYLSTYFDRYDVKVYLYSASGESHDNVATVNFATLIKGFHEEASKTNYKGVYFIESADQEQVKRYLTLVPIEQYVPAGFVVLDLSLKKMIPENVFPELLVDNKFVSYFKNSDFSYAFFQEKKLAGNSGNFNYDKNFDTNKLGTIDLYRVGVQSGGFTHIGVEDDFGRTAVVSAPDYPFFYVWSNFSFLFVIGLCFVLFLLIFYALVLWIRGERLNYAVRIQVYVYLAFLLPLIAVSITTLSLISKSEVDELESDFLAKSKAIGARLSGELNAHFQSEGESTSEFENQLLNLTRLANLDASVFSADGRLLASSQPLIYQNHLVSELIDRQAWTRIVKEKEASFVKNDAIGKLNFNTSYSALKSPVTGALIGVLSIPFFDSGHSLEKTQIRVWLNILVIFVIIFLLFSVVSFLIVNWLTFPLRLITHTLGKTSFSGENKPITWKSKDEIGLMVSMYNKMLENLESSKVELARSQKESAWREIAKQIAHEVNNPLTPMKLTLQRMELAQLKGDLRGEDVSNSLKTLLAQVEILSQIASSFSSFARMPAPALMKMDISEVLKKVVNLHASDGAVIELMKSAPVIVMGDEQLLTRVFSNIILNALQAVDHNRKMNIKVDTKIEQYSCLVSIADNGKGISDELKEKVFLPHFSTKETGSGIGLAIARQGIELSGGEIWFESKVGVGTVFYVKLPLPQGS